MAEVSSSSVKAEPAPMNGVNKTQPGPESATPQKTGYVNATTPQSSSTEVASPEANGSHPNKISGSARKPSRTPPKLDAATENHVRDMMNMARRVANGGDNPFKSEQDIKDLALLTNNLVKLMNATYIATDTIVRGVAYMQGESKAHPKTAMNFARRDRRAHLAAEKAAEQALGDTTNQAPAETGAKDITRVVGNDEDAGAAGDDGSRKENAAPSTEGQQQNSNPAQKKTSKKKGYWSNRRALRKRKDSAISKTQENKVDGKAENVGDVKDTVDSKGTVKEHKPKTSGSDTIVGETAKGENVVVTVMA
ncbi:hypothetical protein, variant [Phialophora macrospora]|uniref:Uncharacterized protein n=1 Tax=Phialophora macrospora TaxID=1851006 RepID=A0A0D2CZ11_9EURO|nr:hypothetical protein PV04_02710 [Phialophora macrospora]KIW70441.1 hypothetical protein, variant [Phialophora macrospora]